MSQIFGTHRANYERELKGYQWIYNPQPTNPLVTDVPPPGFIFIRQEAPFHPGSVFRAGVQGPNVRAPISDTLFIRQQQPDHPLPFVRQSRQGPNVRPPISDGIFLRQQMPDHPLPRVWRHHPTTASIGIGITSYVITRQEQPFQALWPPPPMRSGIPTASETCFARIIGVGL